MTKFMHVHTLRNRGFTLIELLVVIAIIGMLSSVVLASLNGARIKARDARRLADFKSVQTALELYYDSQSTPSYPVSTGALMSSVLSGLAPAYLGTVPTDPSRANTVVGNGYQYCSDGQVYALIMMPEKTNAYCTMANGTIPSSCTNSATIQAYPTCK